MTAIANLVHQVSTTTGTGPFALNAVNGRQTFNLAFGNGVTPDVFYYFISNRAAGEWEWGKGHLSAADVLVRDTVLGSSNANLAVSFSGGTKDVTNALPAEYLSDQLRVNPSTLNAVPVFSDTVGSLRDTGVLIDLSNNLAVPGGATFTPASANFSFTRAIGTLQSVWTATAASLDFLLNGVGAANLYLKDTAAGADLKSFQINRSNTLTDFRALTDAGAIKYTFLSLDHSTGLGTLNGINPTPYPVIQPSSGNFRGSGASGIDSFVTQFWRSDQNGMLNADAFHHFSTDPSAVTVLTLGGTPTSGDVITLNFSYGSGPTTTSVQYTVQPGNNLGQIAVGLCAAIRSNATLYNAATPPAPNDHTKGGGYAGSAQIGYTVHLSSGLAFDYRADRPLTMSYSVSGAATETVTFLDSWFSFPTAYNGGTTGGSANAQTATATGFTLLIGKWLSFVAGFSNSGAATLNVNGLGAIAFRKTANNWPSGLLSALSGGEIVAGSTYVAVYDGTFFRLHQNSVYITNGSTPSTNYLLPNYLDNNPVYVTGRVPGLAPATGSVVFALYGTGPTTADVTTRGSNYGNIALWIGNTSYSGSSPSDNVRAAWLIQPSGSPGWWFGQGIYANSGGAPWGPGALEDRGIGSINLPKSSAAPNAGIWFDSTHRLYWDDGANQLILTTSGALSLSGSAGVGINATPTGNTFNSALGGFFSGTQVPTTGSGISLAGGATPALTARNYGTATNLPLRIEGSEITLRNASGLATVVNFGVVGVTSATLVVAGGASGTTAIQAAAAASGTLTLPAATDTLVGKATTDTLTNKTLTSATLATKLVKGVYVIAASAVQSSHTGTTAETTLATIAVPANSLGANGILRITVQWGFVGVADTKRCRIKFNGTDFIDLTAANTSLSARHQTQIANRNATNSQVGTSIAQANWNTVTLSPITSAHDTTGSLNITITGQLANAADTVAVEGYLVELILPS
jgi:hypothetical protein